MTEVEYPSSVGSNKQMSQTTSPRNFMKPMAILAAVLLPTLVLILYLPTLAAPPLYDEHFLSFWLKHLLKIGLKSETLSFLLGFSGFDPRDAYLPLGTFSLLVNQLLFRGGHLFCVFLHGINSLLVYFAAAPKQSESDETSETAQLATALVAALLFALSPLAPEAVSWAGGLPLELGVTVILAGLLFALRGLVGRQKQLLIVASVLLAVSPLFSLRNAGLILAAISLIAIKARTGGQNKAGLSIILAALLTLSTAFAINMTGGQAQLPPKLAALKVPRTEAAMEEENVLLEKTVMGNMSVLVLPINKKINSNYNKLFRNLYLLLPLPLLLALLGMIDSLFRRRILITLGLFGGALLLNSATLVDRENFYGMRWLYSILPLFSYLTALSLTSPLYLLRNKNIGGNSILNLSIRAAVTILGTVLLALFLFPRAYTQNLSYKSNGKLWKTVQESIQIAATKENSPFIVVRDLPQSLTVAPMLSPFDPLLIDGQKQLPRCQFISSGKLIDGLRQKQFTNICLTFDQNLGALIRCEYDAGVIPFPNDLKARQIADLLAPPLAFYNGAIKLDDTQENLLLESNSKAGPACRINCDGLSQIGSDFLYVEAKIDTAMVKAHNPLELHWVTNRKPDWEPRERRVIIESVVNDGQYHRYYFPLRSTNFALNGFPTHIMVGFPGGAKVALRAMGLATQPRPSLTVHAQTPQDTSKDHFAAFCFNYPDLDSLGLVAVYGKDNGLDLSFDTSSLATASKVKIEIGSANRRFRSENAEGPEPDSVLIERPAQPGRTTVSLKDLPNWSQLKQGCVLPVRIFAVDDQGKILEHASDSSFCLVFADGAEQR